MAISCYINKLGKPIMREGLEFSLKAAWNKRFRLYQRKLKLEL